MSLLICPGVHERSLTNSLLQGLELTDIDLPASVPEVLIFPAEQQPAYLAGHILQFLQTQSNQKPQLAATKSLVFLCFSAGVVGAIAAAWAWQLQGGTIKAFIAVDGWGVPLSGNFPIHRLSHDWFTHWSSALLGAGETSFYADPAVPHLELWRSPQTALGRSISSVAPTSSPVAMTAATFLKKLLMQYGECPGINAFF